MAREKINLLMILAIVGLLLIGSVTSTVSGKETQKTEESTKEIQDTKYNNKKIKNIIVMVPDGCSQSVQTMARWYSGEELQLDSMVTGMVTTYMADSIITDSASAATAFATGYKTSNGFLSVGPNGDTLLSTIDRSTVAEEYVPLATILEGSKLEGKATGLVATSSITHATPAAFAVHVESREMNEDIMEQLVYQDIDVVFGGGEKYLINRADEENLKNVLIERDYQYLTTKDEMDDPISGKVWGMFAASHMKPDEQREETEEPSIEDMTSKAIEILSQDKDGFFLMVEGSQVDWAGHANDPVYMVTDFLAFDEAVEEAVNFAEEDGHTLVIVFPDHNTGGLTIGNQKTNDKNSAVHYTELSVEELVNPLKGENGEVVVGWTTGGHCGEDVPLWAYGPNKPVGLLDNTEIATYIAEEFGFSLDKTSDNIFVDVDEIFPGKYVLDKTDSKNPVLEIGAYKLPINKDVLIDSKGVEHKLDGIVIYAPKANDGKGKVYIPQQAVDMINGKNKVKR